MSVSREGFVANSLKRVDAGPNAPSSRLTRTSTLETPTASVADH
jgi:hypothetical protein